MWLRHNIEVAQTRMAKSEPIRFRTERLQDELCRELNLKDIQWDCGWDTTHKIGKTYQSVLFFPTIFFLNLQYLIAVSDQVPENRVFGFLIRRKPSANSSSYFLLFLFLSFIRPHSYFANSLPF